MQRKPERPLELEDERRILTRFEGVGLAAVIAFVIALACAFSCVRSAESHAPTPATTVARARQMKNTG